MSDVERAEFVKAEKATAWCYGAAVAAAAPFSALSVIHTSDGIVEALSLVF